MPGEPWWLTWGLWGVGHVLAAVVLHEAGHALLAVLLGGRVGALGVGVPRGLRRVARLGSVLLYAGVRPWLGVNVWLLPPLRGFGTRGTLAVVAAGPAVNGLVAAACGAVASSSAGGGDSAARWWLAAAVHGLCGVANLLPDRRGGTPSDGTQLWAEMTTRLRSSAVRSHGHAPQAPAADPRVLRGLARAARRAGCSAWAQSVPR